MIQCKVLVEGCRPTRATSGSAGLDLYSAEDTIIKAGSSYPCMVRLGVAFDLLGCSGLLLPRSSMASKHSLTMHPGLIDPDYRGEVCALFWAMGRDVEVFKHQRVAQLVVFYSYSTGVLVDFVDELEPSERGEGGWGSTGDR